MFVVYLTLEENRSLDWLKRIMVLINSFQFAYFDPDIFSHTQSKSGVNWDRNLRGTNEVSATLVKNSEVSAGKDYTRRQALYLRLDIKRCTIIKIYITWGGVGWGGTTRVLFCSDNNSIVIYIYWMYFMMMLIFCCHHTIWIVSSRTICADSKAVTRCEKRKEKNNARELILQGS